MPLLLRRILYLLLSHRRHIHPCSMAISSLPAPKKATNRTQYAKDMVKSGSAGDGSSASSLETRLTTLYAALANSSDLNPLIDLTDVLGTHLLQRYTEKHVLALRKGIQFLVRSLQALLKEGRIPVTNVSEDGSLLLTSKRAEGQSEAQIAVTQWLQTRWNDAIQLFCQLLACQDEETRLLALHSLMALQRDASSALSAIPSSSTNSKLRGQWSRTPWNSLMMALLYGPPARGSGVRQHSVSADIASEFTDKYLQEYDDVRYAFCKFTSDVLQRKGVSSEQIPQLARANVVQFMFGLTAIPTKDEHLNTFLVKELEVSKKKQGLGSAKMHGDDASDEDESVEDWFSDSDGEGSGPSGKSLAAGLGSAARSTLDARSSKRRLRRNPPFADAVHSLAAQRAAYSRAWLSILLPTSGTDGQPIGGTLNVSMTHEALVRMHAQIMPHLAKPNLLHDFLVDALDAGGATALLALNTLFTLMTKHNLNYASFYTRLYALLLADPPFLHVRYRSRFLRLLDLFLSSTHLPATLIASFAKRLARTALHAPPAAIIVVLPFVWNLCKRHKHCLGLIHREFGNDRFDQGPAGIEDPYDALETDPLKTNAIDSSLWELAAMGSLLGASQQTTGGVTGEGQMHYLASVSSLSRILAEPFTKERYGLEDFLDLTYGTLFETETAKTLRRREGKKVIEPAVAYDLPRNGDGKRAALFGQSPAVTASKKIKLVHGEEEQDDEEDADLREARQAIDEARASQHVDMCSRIFAF